ncbi:MAG: hypothetical protein QOH98_1622, partial [Methylobacteriaceae bacterium]|nr:hypothetical protein [Methylobacteriaceae bacterium]
MTDESNETPASQPAFCIRLAATYACGCGSSPPASGSGRVRPRGPAEGTGEVRGGGVSSLVSRTGGRPLS